MTKRSRVLAVCALLSCWATAASAQEEPFTPAEYAAAVDVTQRDFTVHAVLGPSLTPLPLDLSNFLLDHPDLSAYVVNVRAIAPYRIIMLGPRRSLADDGDGTRGVVNLLRREDRRRLYYGEGVHHSAVFPDIHAVAVIEMTLTDALGTDGRPATSTTFEVWVRMRSGFMARLIKTLRPFLQGVVVGKFSKAFWVADSVGRALARQPDSVTKDVLAFPLISAEESEDFLRLAAGLTTGAAPAR